MMRKLLRFDPLLPAAAAYCAVFHFQGAGFGLKWFCRGCSLRMKRSVMEIAVFAVGRLKKSAETDLTALYAARFKAAAPHLGLQFGGVCEAAESRAQTAEMRKKEEFAALAAQLKPNSLLVLLDERGKSLSSRRFAENLAAWRDEGRQSLILALGGPNGFSDAARARADMLLSFGQMTWPHRLARIMLSEQLYRAAMILSGHPYHRD